MKHFNVIEHTVPCSHIRHHARATSLSQEEELLMAVKQYEPIYQGRSAPLPGDMTIIACPALGFPKELYEPVWDMLFDQLESAGEQFIRNIWVADPATQGSSGVLNQGKLGSEPSWSDYARDFLNMVNHFRHEMPRPIVGFGHSMGAVVILNLANMHQRLLTSIVTIEPVLNKSTYAMPMTGVFPLTYRKDCWKTREEALSAFVKGPLYKNFHPEVVQLFGQYGLRDNADGTVGLTTTKAQELFAYARAAYPPTRDQDLAKFTPTRESHADIGLEAGTGRERNPQEAFYRPEAQLAFGWLPFLKPSVLMIHGSRSHFIGSSPKGRKERIDAVGWATGGSGGARDGRVKDVVIKGSHFVPMDNPSEVAAATAEWFTKELQRWKASEEEEMASWYKIPLDKRAELSDDWKFWAKKVYAGKQPGVAKPSAKPAKL